jgi:hypothetical protein
MSGELLSSGPLRVWHRWVPKETGSPHLVRHAGRGRAAPGEAQDSISAVAAIWQPRSGGRTSGHLWGLLRREANPINKTWTC